MKTQIEQIEQFDNTMLDIGFIEGVFDVLKIIDGHRLIAELKEGSAISLLSEAEERLQRLKAHFEALLQRNDRV